MAAFDVAPEFAARLAVLDNSVRLLITIDETPSIYIARRSYKRRALTGKKGLSPSAGHIMAV